MKKKIRLNNLENHYQNRFNNSRFYKLNLSKTEETSNIKSNLVVISSLIGFSAISISYDIQEFKNIRLSIEEANIKSKLLKLDEFISPLIFCRLKISMFKKNQFNDLLNKIEILNKLNIFSIEFDLDSTDQEFIKNIIQIAYENFVNKSISLIISRKIMSNAIIIDTIKSIREIVQNDLIVEVDGVSSHTDKNEFNNTLQTISTADILNKQLKLTSPKYNRIPLILSGGTNIATAKFADQCGVLFNGISFDISYFRDLDNNFMECMNSKSKLKVLTSKLNNLFL